MTLRTKISDSSYTEYTWDYRNRLTNVTDKTSGGTSTMSADYTYDVYDRRIKKVVDLDGAGGGGSVTTRYVYEDQGITRVVLQFDGSNNLTHRNLHGPAIDQLLADEDSGNALLWSLADHLGTVRDLINNSAVTQNHLTYGAFGNVTSESASAVDFLMGFASMGIDDETSATWSLGSSLQNGRWISESGTLPQNPYLFATNVVRCADKKGRTRLSPKQFKEEVEKTKARSGQEGLGLSPEKVNEMGKMLTDMYNAGGIKRALAEEAVTTGGFHFKRGQFPRGNPDDRSVAINPDVGDIGLRDLKNGKSVPIIIQTPNGPKRFVIPKEVGKEVAPKNSAESALGHELGHSILGLKDYFNKEKLPPEGVDAIGKDNIPFIPGSPSGVNTLLEQFMREEDNIDPRKSYFLCPLDTQEEFDPDEVARLRDFLKGYDLQPWLDKLDKISPEPPPKPESGSYDTRKIYEANPGLGPWP